MEKNRKSSSPSAAASKIITINNGSTNQVSGSEFREPLMIGGGGVDEVDALPRNLRYSNFDCICTLISIATYIFDLVMDIIVAVYFYHLGVSHSIYHYWYFGLTLLFILLPSLTMTGFSFRWYLMDEDDENAPAVPLWRWVLRLAMLMLQIAPILRYVDSMRNGILSRYYGRKAANEENQEQKERFLCQQVKYYTFMVYEEADATLLRLFECFMESAPQLVLQIYILIRDPHAIQVNEMGEGRVDPIIKVSILFVSVISSLVSLAWSLVVYHRSLRYTYEDKNNINWIGSIFQFLWHFSSITARVLALSLFAAIYPKWIGPVIVAHWIIMSSWVVFQQTEACHTKCEELFFALVLGVIYIFSFFNAKEERTRYKYLIYYTFCFLENTVLVIFWALMANDTLGNGEQQLWYYYPSIIGHYVMFFSGIFFMVTYYLCFHPSGDIDFELKKYFRLRKKRTATPQPRQSEFLDLKTLEEHNSAANLKSLPEAGYDCTDGNIGSLPNYQRPGHRVVARSFSAPTDGKSPMLHLRTFKDMRKL